MKKLFIILFLFSINIFNSYWAEYWAQWDYQYNTSLWNNTESNLNTWVWPTVKNAENLTPWPTTVVVTEKIPWAECSWDENQPIESRKFTCKVQPGFGSVMQLFAGLVKYATFLAALVGVLMIAVAWVRLSISGIESGEKAKAKEMITKVIFSLILLFLIWFILNSVAPWIYN